MKYPKEVTITEVCPRDGFQSLSTIIPTEAKIEIINKLMECNYKQIEVTSFVHPKAIPQLKDADEVLMKINRKDGVKLRALIPNVRGLDRAIEAGVDKVKLMLSATDSHSINNANCSTNEALRGFGPTIKKADESSMHVSGSISVAFGCPYEGEVPVERLIHICEIYRDMGITEISLADTTGMANPMKVRKVLQALKAKFPRNKFTLHLHNTRGMAFANAVTGLEEGVSDFDSSVSGLGGCPYAPNASGNIASEDLIHGFEEMGIKTGINLDKVMSISKHLSTAYPEQADSFLLKAGKCSDLHIAPSGQNKLG
jgi:hydroxymethylglutaryl-CoA lyase